MAKTYADKYFDRLQIEQTKDIAYKQCEAVNPSNPMAVARNIEKMIKALKGADALLQYYCQKEHLKCGTNKCNSCPDRKASDIYTILADIKKEG